MGRPDEAANPHIVVRGVHLAFGDRVVFDSLDCDFPRGRVSVILGGSGGGKSSLLRLIAGLVRPQAGRVLVAGRDVARLSDHELARVRDDIGMLFQGGALLDSLSVFDNLALPLREHARPGAAEVATRVAERLSDVGLPDAAQLLPSQLSGGMARRVGLARALVRDPGILLCDEPFSGLDPGSVRKIEQLLTGLQRRRGMTMVVVSHHIASTLRMADQILLLLPGRCWRGSPAEFVRSDDPDVRSYFEPALASIPGRPGGEAGPAETAAVD